MTTPRAEEHEVFKERRTVMQAAGQDTKDHVDTLARLSACVRSAAGLSACPEALLNAAKDIPGLGPDDTLHAVSVSPLGSAAALITGEQAAPLHHLRIAWEASGRWLVDSAAHPGFSGRAHEHHTAMAWTPSGRYLAVLCPCEPDEGTEHIMHLGDGHIARCSLPS